jgi:hypothetical protein
MIESGKSGFWDNISREYRCRNPDFGFSLQNSNVSDSYCCQVKRQFVLSDVILGHSGIFCFEEGERTIGDFRGTAVAALTSPFSAANRPPTQRSSSTT